MKHPMREPVIRYLSSQDVADLCGVPIKTVEAWIHSGRLSLEDDNGEPMVTMGALVEFMEQNDFAIPIGLLNDEHQQGEQETELGETEVLIIDEDRPMANAIERVIRQMGLDVVQVNNGFDATINYFQRKPQLMTLDLDMDGMSGVELIQNIRATQTHNAKILVISNSAPSLLARAKTAGADATLAKPFDNDSLRRAVRILLGL